MKRYAAFALVIFSLYSSFSKADPTKTATLTSRIVSIDPSGQIDLVKFEAFIEKWLEQTAYQPSQNETLESYKVNITALEFAERPTDLSKNDLAKTLEQRGHRFYQLKFTLNLAHDFECRVELSEQDDVINVYACNAPNVRQVRPFSLAWNY